MLKIGTLIILLTLCACNRDSNGYFVDRFGHTIIKFSGDYKKYYYQSLDGEREIGHDLINCTDSEYICLKGPFIFKEKKSKLRNITKEGEININSSDGEKLCRFIYKTGKVKGISQFECDYFSSDAPNKTYFYVNNNNGEEERFALDILDLY